MILLFALTITSTCIKAYEDIIGKRSAVYAAFSDISRFMVDCRSPCGPIVDRLDKWESALYGDFESNAVPVGSTS